MRSRGFTLVEVVLAMTILALIMGLVFGSFFSQNRVDQAARSEAEAGQTARLFLDLLLTDINQTLGPERKGLDEPPLSGAPQAVESLQGHKLTLIAKIGGGLEGVGGTGPGSEPVVRIVYLAEPGRNPDETPNGRLSIRRKVESLLGEEVSEEIVCTDVASLVLTYVSAEGREVQSWEDGNRLPLEVRVQLDLAPLGGPVKTYELLCGPLTALAWSRRK